MSIETADELVEETTDSQAFTKIPRLVLVDRIRQRDGDLCALPDCHALLDFNVTHGPLEVTIDHWIPQIYGKTHGWTMNEIWGIDNLRLMHKKCNAKKGDLVPHDDGSLPDKPLSNFKFRRQKRATRPDMCFVCDNGRKLGPTDVCASCNSGPQPERYPRWAKMKSTECDHELFWCPWCSIGIIERAPAVNSAVRQGESGEWQVSFTQQKEIF